ncbi:GAF domain-containing protein [Haladaptatus sp. CMAA 1911]|uniref:GAF domain-containing protein n=1 Tax=unclassified Haladaptatus TaxID=2622732 RepID=UPI00375448A4
MSSSAPSPATVLKVFNTLGPPGTPFTTPEVAEEFDCTDRTIYNKLNALVEDDAINTKKVGAKGRVFWRPVDDAIQQNGGVSDLTAPVSLRDGQSPVFLSDSEMTECIREFDWVETSLGPMAEWPTELRVAVDLMLGADEAIGIYWGEDLVLLYNDAAREQIGKKHPNALGRPARDVFPEAWEFLGPMHEQVMAGEGPVRVEDQYLPIERGDAIEDVWWDSSFNPIPLADGSVGGVFNISVDITDRVQVETALRESKEQLEVALNAAEMGTWEWDLEARTVDGDDTMLSLFDLPPTDEPVPVEQFLVKESDEGTDQAEDTMEFSFEPGEEIQDEVELEGVDTPRWISWRGRASADDPTVLRGVSFDITDRKQAEIEREQAIEELRESEERYRTLFDSLSESMQEAFCIVELPEEGEAADEASTTDGTVGGRSEPDDYRFVEANPAFEELTGVTDVVGARWSDLDVDGDFPGFDVCAEVARTGESQRVETTGEPLIDGWFDVRVFPYGGSDSRQVAVLIEDITEQKETEAALRENEKRLRLATDIANIAVFEWDLETDLVSGNKRINELFGYDEHETIVGAKLLEERIHPDDLESVNDQLEAVFESASDGDYEFEFRARRPDGGERWVLTNGEVFFEEDEDDRRAVRVFGTGIDITEQKQREERQEFLLRFSDALRAQPDAESIEETAVEMLAEQLDVDRCWIAKVSEEEGVARVGPERFRSNLQPMSGTFQISDSQEVMRRLATQTIQIPNLADDPRFSDSEKELHAGLNIVALLSVPLRKGEHEVIWAFPAAMAEPRQWTDNERILLEEAAERTWEAVERAQAEQDLAAELDAMKRLQEVSTQAIQQDDDGAPLYESVLEASMDLVDAEFGTIQRLDSQAHELDMFVHRGFSGEMIAHWDRVDVETSSSCGRALQTEERVVVPDVQSCEFIEDGEDLEAFDRAGIRSVQTTPLVSRSGELLGMLSTHWADTHEPSERDLHLLDVISRQVADLMQQRAAYEALEESEEKYRSLFEEIDEGFALCELVRDADGTVSDLRYLELNEAFEALTGVSRADSEGRLLTEVFPGQDESLFEQCRGVAETGEPERVETYVPANDRWYDVHMFPREGDVIAALYDDITERKRREQHEQFLLELSDQLHTLTTEEEIGEACARLLAEELGLDRAYFVRFDADAEEALVGPEYHSSSLDPVSGLYPFSAFPEAIQQIGTETPVYHDVASDSTLPEAERQALLELDFGAWIGAPIRTDEEGVDWALYAVHSDPHDWSDAEISLIEEVADRTWTVVERARAERALTQSNQSLERLNEVSRKLIDADPATISDQVADLVVDILDVEYAALWRYDKQTGDIELHSEHAAPATDLSAVRLAEVSREQIWQTFIGDEIDVENALDIADGEPWPSGLGSRMFVPLGRHGVICVGSVHSETFDERLLDLIEMIASTVETAWDRAESEQTLARRNTELSHLDSLNTLIRTIDQALVEAETVEAIDEAVCERLAHSELFEFAWVGEFDASHNTVEPRAWAGVDSRSLDALTTEVDGPMSNGNPFTAAIETRDIQLVNDIATDAQASLWREIALDLGARSCVSLPLVYDDFIYGIVTVYRGTPQHDERDIDVLAELGRTIANAIHAVETREAHHMNRVVELTLRSTAADTPLCQLAQQTGCVMEITGLVPGADGEITVFFTATDISTDALVTAGEQSLAIEELICLSEREDGSLFKARLSESTLTSWFLDRDAMTRSLTIDNGTATLVLDVPTSVDIRSFVETGQQAIPDLELLARRTRTRSPDTTHTLQTAFTERLTDRQQEILQLAYRSGFFESPRLQTGNELSTALDLSQSTFNYHLRGAERRLLEVVFD